jgi:hypothetical protein
MQIPFVMMLAITGLGCQNKANSVMDPLPLISSEVDSSPLPTYQGGGYSASTHSGSFTPTAYPEIPSRIYASDLPRRSIDWHAGFRSTLWSFVLGRDPDVITVREIEASVYGPSPGR